MTRRAAAVKTADVVIGEVYAIKDEDEKLQRFSVRKLITERRGNSPAEVEAFVEGVILKDEPGSTFKYQEIRLHKRRLLGEYHEYAELVAREAAVKKAQAEAKEAAKQVRIRAIDLLNELAGLKVEKPEREYNTNIKIEEEDQQKLLDWLETIKILRG